jgi:hypothetical protein
VKNLSLVSLLPLVFTLFYGLPAFAGSCHGGSKCVGMMIGCALLWLVVSAVFLMYTWNTVIAVLFQTKKANFMQALLFVATMLVFCLPKHMMMKHAECGHMQCHDKEKMEEAPSAPVEDQQAPE